MSRAMMINLQTMLRMCRFCSNLWCCESHQQQSLQGSNQKFSNINAIHSQEGLKQGCLRLMHASFCKWEWPTGFHVYSTANCSLCDRPLHQVVRHVRVIASAHQRAEETISREIISHVFRFLSKRGIEERGLEIPTANSLIVCFIRLFHQNMNIIISTPVLDGIYQNWNCWSSG
jgi:hypothetical protein